MSNTQNRILTKMVIRIPKNESAFTYFTLEANDGISFYSTLEGAHEDPYRDIEIFCDKNLEEELLHILNKLHEKFPINILEHTDILDEITNDNNI